MSNYSSHNVALLLCKGCRVLQIENLTQLAPSGSFGLALLRWVLNRQVLRKFYYSLIY